jgi:hypothetical protein
MFWRTSLRGIIAKVSAAEKFYVTGQRFDIYGICQGCDRKGKTTTSKDTAKK